MPLTSKKKMKEMGTNAIVVKELSKYDETAFLKKEEYAKAMFKKMGLPGDEKK